MRIIPESANRQDWPRLVAQKVKELSLRITELLPLIGASGWEVYNHGGGAQTLVAGVRKKLEIDGATSQTNQAPIGVASLWDKVLDRITGRNGDAIVVKVQFVFTPDDATASDLSVDVDLRGPIGIVEKQDFAVIQGAGVPHSFAFTFLAFQGATFEANGGEVYATCDGPGVVTNMRVVIARVHKARV